MSKLKVPSAARGPRPWRRFRVRVVDECACAIHERVLKMMRQRDAETRPDRVQDINAVIGGMMAATTIVRGLKYGEPDAGSGLAAPGVALELAEVMYNQRFGDALAEKFIKGFGEAEPRVRTLWLGIAQAALDHLRK